MKKIIYIFLFILIVFSIALIVIGQTSDEDKDYLIGEADRKTILPEELTYTYKSEFANNTFFQIKYSFENKSFLIVNGEKNLGPNDSILNQFEVSHYPFVFEEYLLHVGTDKPKQCQSITFYIDNDSLVKEGQYQLCKNQPEIILLKALIDEEYMELVYDSSTSDKITRDGIWEGITGK